MYEIKFFHAEIEVFLFTLLGHSSPAVADVRSSGVTELVTGD